MDFEKVCINVSAEEIIVSLFWKYCKEHDYLRSIVDPHEMGITIRMFSEFIQDFMRDRYFTDDEEVNDDN